MPHLAMNNNRSIIECCDNTHQGASCTGNTSACTSDLGDVSHVSCISALCGYHKPYNRPWDRFTKES